MAHSPLPPPKCESKLSSIARGSGSKGRCAARNDGPCASAAELHKAAEAALVPSRITSEWSEARRHRSKRRGLTQQSCLASSTRTRPGREPLAAIHSKGCEGTRQTHRCPTPGETIRRHILRHDLVLASSLHLLQRHTHPSKRITADEYAKRATERPEEGTTTQQPPVERSAGLRPHTSERPSLASRGLEGSNARATHPTHQFSDDGIFDSGVPRPGAGNKAPARGGSE